MTSRLIIVCCLLGLSWAYRPFSGQPQTFGDLLKINRVVGGKSAVKGEFPHQVSLQYGFPPLIPLSHICGGSIISDRWILTAGHCVNHLPRHAQFVVKAGKHYINRRELTEQISVVSDIYIHENYKGDVSPFDIALLQLITPFQFNQYISAINLPSPHVLPQGTAFLSGWGSTSKTRTPSLPSELQKVPLPILDIGICRRAMILLGQPGSVHDTNLCTGPLTGGYSSCSGDSGGPLIKVRQNGVREIIGVVSWGVIPCGGAGAPAVFVRVSAFTEWINSIIINNS